MNWRGDEEGRLAQLQCASVSVMTSRLKKLFQRWLPRVTSEEQNVLRIRDYLNQHFTENIITDANRAIVDIQLLMSHISLKTVRVYR